jgi:hypothetical protein
LNYLHIFKKITTIIKIVLNLDSFKKNCEKLNLFKKLHALYNASTNIIPFFFENILKLIVNFLNA